MNRTQVIDSLRVIRHAEERWRTARARFAAQRTASMQRLIHEALVHRLSPDEIAAHSGLTPKAVRLIMRSLSLDPKRAISTLSKQAATALAENATLMGIEPKDMDLMSPLAYLPMGQDLRARLADAGRDQTVSGNMAKRDRLAVSLYGDGSCPEWYKTTDATPNAAAYELADRILNEMEHTA